MIDVLNAMMAAGEVIGSMKKVTALCAVNGISSKRSG
ncbi:hypothetical protein FHS94_002418 [Sphingomonas aerophila]|jgi:hypothetical protein|uniref:Uncharacterized protein n=1 Tax=Sphingomonas aerophila TaxID=1344948 RepID=A0A7W9BE82_9SPHN|nr:hypothetical protein [Sphingomonas aerophila]